MSRFNLIDEKWIPVRFLDGTRGDLGIMDTLLCSKKIAAIEDQSPLVVAALHRFLLAVLYRALQGPTDVDQAKELFKTGLPEEKLKAYLEKWRDRFWLFDEKYPFSQIPSFKPKEWRAWTVLAAEHNADNAKVLFDHIDVTTPGGVTPAFCVRWLLAVQTFSVSAGKSELAHTGTAPSATAAMFFPQGQNLTDTLIFGLVPENKEVIQNDKAVWEIEPETIEELKKRPEHSASGLANVYTWRSRSVLLKQEEGNISWIAFASGIGYKESVTPDPMVGYRINEKYGKLPIQFRERGLWRSFDSLLPSVNDKNHLAPQIISNAVTLGRVVPDRFPKSLLVLGQANNKAKIDFWRMEHFVLPSVLIKDCVVKEDIHQLLDEAENTQKSLWAACACFARFVLVRGERLPDKTDITEFVKQMPAISCYWATLESRFHAILNDYTSSQDPDEIRCRWLIHVRDALKTVWEQYAASVSAGDAWTIRALVKAEGAVWCRVKELDNEIGKYKKQEVNQ